MTKRQPLGQVLRGMGVIDDFQLRSALAHQKQWGTPLGQTLVEKGFCTEDRLLAALAQQTGLNPLDLDRLPLGPQLARLLPQKVAQQHRAVALRNEGAKDEVLVVAIAAPADLKSLDDIQAVTGARRLRAFVADDRGLQRAIGRIYLDAEVGPGAHRTHTPVELAAATPQDEVQFELDEETAPERPVLLYGWSREVGDRMATALRDGGLGARIATAEDVAEALPEDVLVSPLPAAEALFASRRRPGALLVVAGKAPELDLPRARALGAVGFLAAPVDPGLLFRAVRRCRARSGVLPHQAA